MRKHLALLFAVSLLAAPAPSAAVEKPSDSANPTTQGGADKTADKLEWLAFDAATAKAQDQHKHLIVDIYTTWCGWCRVMERETYSNPQVAAYLRENFVLAKVNGESSAKMKWRGEEATQRAVARARGGAAYTATYFPTPDAEPLRGGGGCLPA